ncbi:MAG: SDR family oxidoreductase [Microgenomates group bacterium]
MKDKVVIVTGASQGLGKELSLQLVALGAKVALVSRNEKLLIELKEKINSNGGVAEYFICDVTDFNQVNSTVEKILKSFGKIDILINNAGLWLPDQVAATDQSRIEKIFKVNSLGPIYFSQAVMSLFDSQQTGHLLFINSIGGLNYPIIKDWQIYSATKWAITGYAKSLSYKYDNTPIKVTSIYPGPFSSNIDKNAGDDFGADRSFETPVADLAEQIVHVLNTPKKLMVDTLELKNTNWNS